MASVRSECKELVKLTKIQRKTLKKQTRKIYSILKDRSDTEVSDSPTKCLLVGNGGLICGVHRSNLLQVFEPHGKIESIEMIPGKSYSFISFDTVQDAEMAYKTVHGRIVISSEENARPFYLAFVKRMMMAGSESENQRLPLFGKEKSRLPMAMAMGLKIIDEYISKAKEIELINYFKDSVTGNANGGKCGGTLKYRRVRHFGYEFLYDTNNIDKNNPLEEAIPSICNDIIDKMAKDDIVSWKPDQLTVNEYRPGQGIPPHIDTHSAFQDGIISLSLGSQVVMDFRHPDGQHVSVVLPPRSLLVMTGESRYLWTHGITPRKYDVVNDTQEEKNNGLTLSKRNLRLSLTFRTIRHTACECQYSEKCDSQKYKPNKENNIKEELCVPLNEEEASTLEARHVHEVYDTIAEHFSDTRHSPWPRVANFLRQLPAGSFVADIGCGNGKYLGTNTSILCFGSDRSPNLLQICRNKGHCVSVCDILSLPYRSNGFDACICIAVIHHLSTEERRILAIQELTRIVRPGGRVLISVWALEQEKSSASKLSPTCSIHGEKTTSEDIDFSDDILEQKDAHISGNKEIENVDGKQRTKITLNEKRNVFEQQDLLVPWHYRKNERGSKADVQSDLSKDNLECETRKKNTAEQIYQRFYHVFREGELEHICRNIADINLTDSYYDKGNWCIILTKSEL